jgi:cobalt-zinc-cadmium efflux system outer membrane protein
MNRITQLSCIIAVTLLSASDGLADEPPGRQLTLDRALQEASARSPILAAQRALVEQTEARVVTAETYPHDPTLSLEGANREGGSDSSTDWAVKVTQPIEIGGQRRRRVARASVDLDSASASFRREERLLAAKVSAIFVEALRARELLEVEQANTELARSLAEVARKRFEAGSVPQMEVNLAQVQVGRAERDMWLAQGAYVVARAALAEIVGLDPEQPPEPMGELDLPPRPPATLSELVDGALRHRADLEAFRTTIEAARARIDLARREVVPDLAVGAFYGREEGTDRLLGGEIGVRIPLFNRNRGPIAEARAAERQAVAETEAAKLRVRREVAAARARYDASSEASSHLQQQVLGTLEENLLLLQLSFEAGKTGWTEVLVFRREFVDIQRDYIDTLADARLAGIALDLAAGAPASTPHR